ADKLFNHTRTDVSQLEKLGRAIGQKVEKLQGDEDTQKQICRRLAQVVLTKLSTETESYRSGVLQAWIRKKQQATPPQVFSDPTGRPEGEQLLAELFPDPRVRGDIQARVGQILQDPKIYEAQIQARIAPWQNALNARIDELSKAGDRVIQGRNLDN